MFSREILNDPWSGASTLTVAGILGSLVLLWGCGKAPTDPSTAVDALLAGEISETGPGVALMVIRDGTILKKAAYGMADLEHGVPIEADTAFRLASVSKQFTAMAIMMLEEAGQLDYDDPITRFLPDLSRFGDGITIRHLLTHTAGLPDYYDVIVRISGVERPLTRHALDVYSAWGEPLFKPGERYEYSNPGYELLALIVEKASGQTYDGFVEGRIFAPLGMSDSVVFGERARKIEKRAYGYSNSMDSNGYELDDDDPLNYIIGSGGIYSTVDDLYHWDQALYGEQLVSRETLAEAFTPNRLNNGEEHPYGFGWRIGKHLGHRRVSHAGGWVGFDTFIGRYPDDRFSVIVLSNRSDRDAGELAERVAELYLDGARETVSASN